MKHHTESSCIPIPSVKCNSDQDSGDGSQYSPLLISQYETYTSSRLPDPHSQDYFSTPGFFSAEHNRGLIGYPESSQRTVVSEDAKPCLPYTDEHGQVRIGTRSPFLTLTDAFHFPSAQERALSLPDIANIYQQTYLHSSHNVGDLPRSDRDDSAHDEASSRSSSLYSLPRKSMLEKTELLDRYNSPAQLRSGVGTDSESYADFDADSPRDLSTPIQSPASSIPMRSNDLGWSSASTSGTYDQPQIPQAIASSVIQNMDPSISACLPSEHLEQRNHELIPSSSSSGNETIKKKKSKMHQCEVCGKLFPRPSGLKTHMNTHNNLKPFPCGFEGCSRTFTVRSNAKRHLRTHGVETAPTRQPSSAVYTVGFDTPTVLPPPPTATHEMATAPYKLRWMPPSLSTRTNAASLVSVSDDESSDDGSNPGLEDQYKSVLTLPCLSVFLLPSERDPQGLSEEENYTEALLYLYHPLAGESISHSES